MVFSNSVFLFFFLPITLLFYYILLWRKQHTLCNIWLLLVSLGFYAWGEPIYIFLMILSIIANYGFGRWVEKHNKKTKSPMGKKIVALACMFNLGILFVFKYLSWILGMFGIHHGVLASLTLPIGISFYTFQALSYVIDVYRGKDAAQKNIINVGLYIAFFPQLIAGPIVRYGSIAKQLKNRVHSFDKFSEGVWRFCIGLGKKVLIANHIAPLADLAFSLTSANPGYGYAVGTATGPSDLSVGLAWGGAIAFMLQIYFDFSGYSDMAIGLGKMFGFEFNENFNYPYISRSITEYWRRWHISLGEWFRDYLYYPLSLGPAIKIRKRAVDAGMDRKNAGILSTVFVLFVVWMATGIWHGANWTFVVWGLIQFVFIVWEQYRKPIKNEKLGAVLGFITTFLVVLVTKVIFKSETMTQAIHYYGAMLHLNGNVLWDNLAAYWLGQYKVVLILGIIFAFPTVEKINELVTGKSFGKVWNGIKCVAMIFIMIMSASYVIGGGYNPFIYFNF